MTPCSPATAKQDTENTGTPPPPPPLCPDKAIAQTKQTFFYCLSQSKPLIPLQKEEDPETHKTVLTNYMFPQQTRTEDCEYCSPQTQRILFPTTNLPTVNVSRLLTLCEHLQSQQWLRSIPFFLSSRRPRTGDRRGSCMHV